MPFISRIGRPGLLGIAARTAVVAGTATVVSGGIASHQQKKAHTEYEASQYEAAQQAAHAWTEGAPATTTQTARPVDLVAELQRLGELRTQGVLSDAEFAAAKTRLLA